MDTRNVQYNAHGTIDCEIDHPVYGWIPFTASPDDVEPLGREIHHRAIAGQFGAIAPYVPPVIPVVVPAKCTRRQGRLVLLDTPHDTSNKLDAVEAFIAAIPDPLLRRKAEIEYACETWERSNPFLQQMWTTLGGTAAELDALFIDAVAR